MGYTTQIAAESLTPISQNTLLNPYDIVVRKDGDSYLFQFVLKQTQKTLKTDQYTLQRKILSDGQIVYTRRERGYAKDYAFFIRRDQLPESIRI
jgi:hypothetical protein